MVVPSLSTLLTSPPRQLGCNLAPFLWSYMNIHSTQKGLLVLNIAVLNFKLYLNETYRTSWPLKQFVCLPHSSRAPSLVGSVEESRAYPYTALQFFPYQRMLPLIPTQDYSLSFHFSSQQKLKIWVSYPGVVVENRIFKKCERREPRRLESSINESMYVFFAMNLHHPETSRRLSIRHHLSW